MMNLFKSKKDLFEFKHGDKTWYLTSAAKAVEHNGHTYLPLVSGRGDITDEDIDKCETEVNFPYPAAINNAENEDLQALFINKIYFESVYVTIFELYKNETLVIFKGRVTQPKFDDDSNMMTLVCSTAESYQNRNILTRKFQKTCANKIYDRFCGLNFEDWAEELTVTGITGLVVTFSATNSYPDRFFDRGLLHANGIYTSIIKSTTSTLTLYRANLEIAVGDVIKVAPACDQSRQSCYEKFNNHLRFMGFPNIPNSNPVNDQIIK